MSEVDELEEWLKVLSGGEEWDEMVGSLIRSPDNSVKLLWEELFWEARTTRPTVKTFRLQSSAKKSEESC